MNRVCEIAGHVWIEFVEGASEDSIRGAAESQRDRINAHVAEFIPDFDLDSMLEVFEWAEGGEVPWDKITDAHLLGLFAPLLRESAINRTPLPSEGRPPAGAVPGRPNMLSPDQVRKQPTVWFRDRREPFMTPVWEVKAPGAVIASVIREREGLRYSYTPEHYHDADNCVTWAWVVLDRLVPGDWLETILTQYVSPRLAPEGCRDYDIRECGRMRCAEGYGAVADAQRKEGLRRYS
jgi:hypothetical protein